jgi:hypothetical protein
MSLYKSILEDNDIWQLALLSISLFFLRFCRLGGWRLDVRTLRSFVARCPEDKKTAYTFSNMIFLFVGLVWRGGGAEDSHGEGEQRTHRWNTLRSQEPIIVSNVFLKRLFCLKKAYFERSKIFYVYFEGLIDRYLPTNKVHRAYRV